MSQQLVTIPVPGAGAPILAVEHDGTQWVAARHICDALGIDWKSQHRKLTDRSWSTVRILTTVGSDGKNREMAMVDRHTLTMWLATINESRVAPEVRETLIAYQREAMNALDSYFHKGGAINPRAEEHQLNALLRQSQMQMELCQAAKGLIHPDHLEAKARIVLARGLGEAPELDPATRPLYTADYLKSKNLSTKRIKSVAPMLGKRMKKAYVEKHGRDPEKYDLTLSNGRITKVNGYTEADRNLMDEVWNTYYAA